MRSQSLPVVTEGVARREVSTLSALLSFGVSRSLVVTPLDVVATTGVTDTDVLTRFDTDKKSILEKSLSGRRGETKLFFLHGVISVFLFLFVSQ